MTYNKNRKLISVSEDILDQLARVSRAEGISLVKLVETTLVQAVKINKLGYRSDQMADFFDVLQANRVLGGLFVPVGVLDFMIEKCGEKNSARMQELWRESGQWTGKYLAEKFSNPVEALGRFLELSRWDLNEVDVKASGNFAKIRVVSTVMSLENTSLLAKFIEGATSGIGYKIDQADYSKGMIILSSSRKL